VCQVHSTMLFVFAPVRTDTAVVFVVIARVVDVRMLYAASSI
jgi:hypothetical protein